MPSTPNLREDVKVAAICGAGPISNDRVASFRFSTE